MLENLQETVAILTKINTFKENTLLSKSDLAELKRILNDYHEEEGIVSNVLKKLKRERDDTKIFEELHNLRLAHLNCTEDVYAIADMIKRVSEYYD